MPLLPDIFTSATIPQIIAGSTVIPHVKNARIPNTIAATAAREALAAIGAAAA
jgi:hypothetical protein